MHLFVETQEAAPEVRGAAYHVLSHTLNHESKQRELTHTQYTHKWHRTTTIGSWNHRVIERGGVIKPAEKSCIIAK